MKEKEETIWRSYYIYIFLIWGEERKEKEKEENILSETRQLEEGKEENIWRRKYCFAKAKENGEGNRGKYFEKENIFFPWT